VGQLHYRLSDAIASIIKREILERAVTKSVLRRAARIAATVVLATTAVVGGVASPAQAAWNYLDNMEVRWGTTPEQRFFFDADNENEYGFFEDMTSWSQGAHSDTYAASLHHFWNLGTWVSVGQQVTVGPKALGHPTQCRFSAWTYANSGERFNIEVIDPATWNYITVSTVTQPAGAWSKFSTALFNVPSTFIVLRVSYLPPAHNAAGFVDDFSLACTST
jgi:hypothetical protein